MKETFSACSEVDNSKAYSQSHLSINASIFWKTSPMTGVCNTRPTTRPDKPFANMCIASFHCLIYNRIRSKPLSLFNVPVLKNSLSCTVLSLFSTTTGHHAITVLEQFELNPAKLCGPTTDCAPSMTGETFAFMRNFLHSLEH